jgi:hypothetical protein
MHGWIRLPTVPFRKLSSRAGFQLKFTRNARAHPVRFEGTALACGMSLDESRKTFKSRGCNDPPRRSQGELPVTQANEAALCRASESAGVEFIEAAAEKTLVVKV